MKKLILLALVISSLSFGQYRKSAMEAWYNDVVKSRISALINDSLSASGWQGTGLSNVDSIALDGEMRINGVVSYDQMLSIKNDAVNSKVQSWYNSRGTLLSYVDSAGVINGDTLTIDGAVRLGGLSDYTSMVSIKGGAAHANLLKISNEDGTEKYSIDSAGVPSVGSVHAVRDSFTTTAEKDTVVMAGASATDLFQVTQITTLASATPDSGSSPYYAFFLNTDSVVVGRVPKNSTGSTLKSAGIFDLFRYKKH